jgi:hypothetical protein
MEAFFNIARMAEKTGIDLWNYKSPSGKSLKKAFNVLHPYLAKEKIWEGPQIKPFEFGDGYPLLMEAATRFNCKQCMHDVQKLAGEKSKQLRLHLFY